MCARVIRNDAALECAVLNCAAAAEVRRVRRGRRVGIDLHGRHLAHPYGLELTRVFVVVRGFRFAVAAPGVPQVHVVEGRPGHGHRRGVDARPLQFGQHDRDGSRAVVTAGGYVAAGDDHIPDRGQAGQHAQDQARVGASQELDVHSVAVQFALELVRRSRGDDPAAVYDREPAGQPVRFLQVVRGQQHGHPTHLPCPFLLARQPRDLLPHGGPGLRVQARRRLVEEQHRGPVHQAERHVQAALHAA